jgi:hypothetical protein
VVMCRPNIASPGEIDMAVDQLDGGIGDALSAIHP